MIRIVPFAAALFFSLLTSAGAQEASLSGFWNSNWGDAVFVPDGSGYSGTYDVDNGRFKLQYDSDGRYEGVWAEDESAQVCDTKKHGSYYWGRLSIDVPKDRGSMTLKWGYCDYGELSGRWNISPSGKKPDLTTALEGNWKVTWADYENPLGYVTVSASEAAPDAVESAMGRSFSVAGWRRNLSPAQLYSQSAEVLGNGEINISWSYGHLGHWGGDSTLRQVNVNSLVGEWIYNGDPHRETWRRSEPFVAFTQAQFGLVDSDSDQAAAARLLGPPLPVGKVVTLFSEYAPPEVDMAGNRDTIYLNLFGRDLWGSQTVSIGTESGLTISGYKYICYQEGTMPGHSQHSRQDVCFENGGIAGLSVSMKVWADAKPGLKFLQVNDQKIPFKIDVKDFPEAVADEDLQTKIYSTVLLTDQLGVRGNKIATASNIYPFKADDTPTGGSPTRVLVITGKNLRLDGNTYLRSGNELISYSPLNIPPDLTSSLQGAAHSLAKTTAKKGEEVLVVNARVLNGVRPGIQAFSINGVSARWGLAFADQFGEIRFLRAGSTPLDPAEKRFYTGEAIRIGAKTQSDALPLTGMEILLESVAVSGDPSKAGKRRSLGIFPVTKTSDVRPGHNMAVSEPILLGRKGGTVTIKPAKGEAFIEVDKGAKLVATLVDRLSLIAVPPGAVADVLDKPLRPDLWQKTLNRVAKCKGVGGDPNAEGFESETSAIFEKLILTEGFVTRSTRFTKGDQAALILIRDRLIYLVLEENNKLKPYIKKSNSQRMAMRYYSDAQASPASMNNAFWKYRTGTFPNPDYNRLSHSKDPKFTGKYITIPLAETLGLEAFAKRLKLSKVKTRDLVNLQVSLALKLQYDQTLVAVNRARYALDCNLEELAVIAGQKADKAVASLLPDLVKMENGRWLPDTTARAYVKSVFLLGEELRALDAYSNLDDAYKSMAIAAVAAPIAWAGSAFAALSGSAFAANVATATGYAALAADVTDMIYFGGKGIGDYVAGEENYLTALGISPVLGPEVVKAAIKKRQNVALATVGLIAPMIGGTATLKSLLQIKNVNKGRVLMRGGEGLKSFDELTDVERADVAAYYTYLKDSDASKMTRLFKGEREDMARLDDMIRQAGGIPTDSAAIRSLIKGVDEPSGPYAADDVAKSGDASAEVAQAGNARRKSADPRELETYLSDSELADLDGTFILTPSSNKGAFPAGPATKAPPATARPAGQSPVLAGEAPFKEPLGNSFDILQPANGRFDRSADSSGGLPEGLRIKANNGGEDLVVGKRLGGGGFTEAYKDVNDAEYVIKKRYITNDTMETMVHDSETGRKILLSLHNKEKSMFRVADRKGKPIWVKDPNHPLHGYFITHEENIAKLVNGKRVTNARERFDARDYGATAEEALTIQLAVRELNQKGVVWIDNKLTNLDVVADINSPTGYRVVLFDYDGFRPVIGADAAERYANARKTQLIKDRWNTYPQDYAYWAKTDYDDDLYDYRAFGGKVGDLFSAGETKTGVGYLQLSNLPPKKFKTLVDNVAREHGKPTPYQLPPGALGQ